MNMERISAGSIFFGNGMIATAVCWTGSLVFNACKNERIIFNKCMSEISVFDKIFETFRIINHVFNPYFKRQLCSFEYKNLTYCFSVSANIPSGVYLLGVGGFLLAIYGYYNVYQLNERP